MAGKSQLWFCRTKQSPCFQIRANTLFCGNKNYPCQHILVLSVRFNYVCFSLVFCTCNTMWWNFFQKVLHTRVFGLLCFWIYFSISAALLVCIMQTNIINSPCNLLINLASTQGEAGTWIYSHEKSQGILLTFFFFPNLELFKLEFSGCVFQGVVFCNSFLQEKLGQNWLFISKCLGKTYSLTLKNHAF